MTLLACRRTYLERPVETKAALAHAVRRARPALAAHPVGHRDVHALICRPIAAIDRARVVVVAGREAGRTIDGPCFRPRRGIANRRACTLAAACCAERTQTNRHNDMVKRKNSHRYWFVGFHLEGNAAKGRASFRRVCRRQQVRNSSQLRDQKVTTRTRRPFRCRPRRSSHSVRR